MQNLISNGIKFRSEQKPSIEVNGVEQESEWVFSVKDNGIGVDAKNFDKIFQIFKRLHNQSTYPGTGIGLALCKKSLTIAEAESGWNQRLAKEVNLNSLSPSP